MGPASAVLPSTSACTDFDANIIIAGLDPAIHLPEESF
jgi:hypothetical protein